MSEIMREFAAEEIMANSAPCLLCGCLLGTAPSRWMPWCVFRVTYAALPLPPRVSMVCQSCVDCMAPVVATSQANELAKVRAEYDEYMEAHPADNSRVDEAPLTLVHVDETWIAKITTVEIRGKLEKKRIKITGVQPAAGGLPARYRFTVLNPGDKMQTGSSCSEESLLSHYVREQQATLRGTENCGHFRIGECSSDDFIKRAPSESSIECASP